MGIHEGSSWVTPVRSYEVRCVVRHRVNCGLNHDGFHQVIHDMKKSQVVMECSCETLDVNQENRFEIHLFSSL